MAFPTHVKGTDVVTADSLNDIFQELEDAIVALPVPDSLITGQQIMFAGSSVPDGWLLCDGSTVGRVPYADLFLVIGTTYGSGDGHTTFTLPDYRGRMPIGAGTGSGLTTRSVNAKGGFETVTLDTSHIPAHTHRVGAATANGTAAGVSIQTTKLVPGSTNTNVPFGTAGQEHPNMQASMPLNFIIKT